MFWFYVLPLGFLLTMYTQTGYDASAHISEETHGAAKAAAQGVWRSVFWSGVGGWIVLLAITFAASDVEGINEGLGSSLAVFSTALPDGWEKMVVVIATIGQLFCGMACVTSCSRMMYAFSRDRAVPGWRLWTRLNHHRVPAFAVIGSCVAALLMTAPALEGDEAGAPYAFFAVVSICVIGLYIAYVMPVYLRWRMGDAFQPGPWTLGRKYRWINPAAIIWVAICVIIFCLPFTPAAVPWRDEFDWRYVNYAPITVGGRAADRRRLVGGQRQAHVQGPGAHGRVRRGRRDPGVSRPVIGLCAAVERARWSVWDDEAVLLPRSYAHAVSRAGGLPVLLPPEAEVEASEWLDLRRRTDPRGRRRLRRVSGSRRVRGRARAGGAGPRRAAARRLPRDAGDEPRARRDADRAPAGRPRP